LLFLSLENPGTKFTNELSSTVYANLGSDATFHWKFALDNDWSVFEEIVLGQTDNNARIRNKFITVYKNGNTQINRQLPRSLLTRVSVSGNVTQQGCDLVFKLQSVHRTDEQITYGCTTVVWGAWFRSGPVSLVTQGKVH